METHEYYLSRLDNSMVASSIGLRMKKKKKSWWNWAPMRVLDKIRQQHFHCIFCMFVHTIDGLPSYMEGLRFVVQIERKSKRWETMPSAVFQHAVDFDEALCIDTTVFGRETNSDGISLDFIPKHFNLSVICVDAEEHLLFNRYQIDLSRLLPNSIEEFRETDKRMSSTASFKLGGNAAEAVLVATFDFEVLNEELQIPLFLDGNTTTRFREPSFPYLVRTAKSPTNSPTSSPLGGCVNYFPTPCSSEPESNGSIVIRRVEFDGYAEETEGWSVYDHGSSSEWSIYDHGSSSDEGRFQALRNDPLFLDASSEAHDTASTASPPNEELGSLAEFSTQYYSTKLEYSIPYEDKDTDKPAVSEGNHLFDTVPAQKSFVNSKLSSGIITHIIPTVETNDLSFFELREEKQCSMDNRIILSDNTNCECMDCNENLSADELNMMSEVTAKVQLAGEELYFTDQRIRSVPPFCSDGNEADIDSRPESNEGEHLEQHSIENAGYADVVERLCEVAEVLDEELTILQLSAEDEIIDEASEVFEEFLDLLDKEEDYISTEHNNTVKGALEVSDEDVGFLRELCSLEWEEKSNNPQQELNDFLVAIEGPQMRCFDCTESDKQFVECDLVNTVNNNELNLISIIETAEVELRKSAQSLQSKVRAKIIEESETKTLMKEWGLTDEIFERPEQSLLPFSVMDISSLSDSTSVVKLKDGGCLKVMHSCSGSNLMLQFSNAIVIPAQSTLGLIDVLSSGSSRSSRHDSKNIYKDAIT
ncbi:hypothetical protein KP509_21G033400 [Ceratopteris richardii]|uniref:C2 NT-type domain-containing protein n=1 Tax=Ceratopteris richardii TaxID=49495 RepID=A0A8T2SCD5_CERRI|nr:hypothetical protein KP509_21G033400 [Ceratopteris richardii]